MGVMPRSELAALGNPAMATLLASVVGPWGATLINIGVIISIAGAMFSYTIVTADSAFAPALHGCFPKFLTGENRKKAPVAALILTAAVVQVLLVVVYFQSSTYQAMYTLATSAIMIPFVLSALYCLKVTIHDKRLGAKQRHVQSMADFHFGNGLRLLAALCNWYQQYRHIRVDVRSRFFLLCMEQIAASPKNL